MTTPIKDISFLPLDHPGAKDLTYRARRDEIAKLTREARIEGKLPPKIEYTREEDKTWKTVLEKLRPLHLEMASSFYLSARDVLPISTEEVPQLAELSAVLKDYTGFQVGAVEGLVDGRTFLGAFAEGKMLCTQYIRHASRPEYTPEPDIVHEVIGHVPMFTDPDFVAFSQLIGRAALCAGPEDLVKLERLYWFTIEFGLIQEGRDTRIYGAGLLSSFGEMPHSLGTEVDRRIFNLEEVVNTDYEYSQMQSKLFVIESFEQLRKLSEPFLNSLIHG
jgi:monomeric phenylalanine-4-hydroxylase